MVPGPSESGLCPQTSVTMAKSLYLPIHDIGDQASPQMNPWVPGKALEDCDLNSDIIVCVGRICWLRGGLHLSLEVPVSDLVCSQLPSQSRRSGQTGNGHQEGIVMLAVVSGALLFFGHLVD